MAKLQKRKEQGKGDIMDKNNQISNEINTQDKSNFTLPPGCMVTKREIKPISETTATIISQKKSKNISNKIIVRMIIIGIIACIGLGSIFILPRLNKTNNNKKADESNNSTSVIIEENIATETNTGEGDEIESIPIYSIHSEKDEVASNTDVSIQDNNESTTEDEYGDVVNDTIDGILIGGLVVKYGFDDTWEATIENEKYKARKDVNSNYVSLSVEDSNIAIGNETDCFLYLSNIRNPFETSGELKESQDNTKIVINGKDCYYSSYTGITEDGNAYTTIGIMQDIGGETYAFISIEDTIGYSVENLIQSLSISLENNE